MFAKIGILVAIVIILSSSTQINEADGVHYDLSMTFNFPGLEQPVELTLIPNWKYFPERCGATSELRGCSLWTEDYELDDDFIQYFNGFKDHMIFIITDEVQDKDFDGNSILWHEMKHLLCHCDWHPERTKALEATKYI